MVRPKRKLLFPAFGRSIAALAAAALLVPSAPLLARENEYDVLSKTLLPFEALFNRPTDGPRPAVVADIALAEMTGDTAVPPGSVFHAALQIPDRILISGPVLGQQIAVCRDGKDLWAVPGAQIAAMLATAGPPSQHAASVLLDEISLPFPKKELVFLPILFQVRDAGDETLDGDTCRVLDVSLMPQLAASLKVTDWSARLWVRPSYKPAKLTLLKGDWHLSVLFKKLDFPVGLPRSAWQPSPDQQTNVIHLTAAQLTQLIALTGLKLD